MGIGIRSLGVCIPERRITNEELAGRIDTSDEWIVSHTGIRNRHIGAPEDATSDLAARACQSALERAGYEPGQVDMIITATASGDYAGFPAVACMVQEKIKAPKSAAFDLNAGCTGFVYAMEVARGMIASGGCKTVLAVGAEMLSRITDWTDRDTCVLFGDGAGAAVITELEGDSGILKSILRSDGRGADYLKRTAGGSRFPYREGVTQARDFAISMDGRKVYNFAVGANCDLLELLFAQMGITADDIAYIVPHQANIRIIQAAAKRMKIAEEKYYVNIDEYANTSAASIPIALNEMDEKGLLKKGDLIITIGFGAGLTYGCNLIRW